MSARSIVLFGLKIACPEVFFSAERIISPFYLIKKKKLK